MAILQEMGLSLSPPSSKSVTGLAASGVTLPA